MRLRLLLAFAIVGAPLWFASPASAAPACVMLNWQNNQTCTFEAPAGAFAFGGTARSWEGPAWIAVQVEFNGVVLYSCYGQAVAGEVATCTGTGRAFAGGLTHVCRVFGTGGPKAHCADPPPLPLPLP